MLTFYLYGNSCSQGIEQFKSSHNGNSYGLETFQSCNNRQFMLQDNLAAESIG